MRNTLGTSAIRCNAWLDVDLKATAGAREPEVSEKWSKTLISKISL